MLKMKISSALCRQGVTLNEALHASINYTSRRFLRGSRFPKVSSTALEGEQLQEEHGERERRGQEEREGREYTIEEPGRRSQGQRFQDDNHEPRYEEEMDRQSYQNRRASDRFRDQNVTSNQRQESSSRVPYDGQFERRKSVRTLLRDASTYGAPVGGGRIGGDPFLTGPYVRGTRMSVHFDQGNDAVEESRRRRVDPSTTSVIMFPGQGTQHVGMCGDPASMPRYIQVMYEIASSILNVDLLDICANGPQEKLNQTIYSQPAILVSSLAALERLKDKNPDMVDKCVATAGFSIGEMSALVFSGAISFEDAVRLVKVRAEAMQIASEINPSGMATVLYGADSKLNYSLLVAREWCRREYNIEQPVCSIANYLFPHCKVVAGNNEALEFLQNNYKDFNLKKVKRLPVSGAFHTDLMRPAAEPMKQMLRNLNISRPRMPVFSNVTGYRYHSSDEVRKHLPKQIYKPVMWEQIVHNIYKRPKDQEYPNSFECGPGSSLTTVLKQVNAKAHQKCTAISSSQ